MTVATRITHLVPPYENDVAQALVRMMPKASPVEPLKLFRTFAKNLRFSTAMGPLGGYMLSSGREGGAGYDARVRELIIDRVTARCRCEYEWGVHIASYAAKVGLTDEQVYSTVHGTPEDPCWNACDRAVLRMTDELHDTCGLTDQTFNDIHKHFDEPVIIELLALAGWYHAIAYIANACGTELEDWAPRFPERRA